ncbi:MAG: FAD-dependent oxidoreductase [Mogibacterium sp.]|nr:FAD-dependent oxidoreductase [Mogibacterium sp.]
MGKYDKLFKPVRIGSITLKNRIAMAAMGTNFGDSSGDVKQRAIDYYCKRAEGGTALLITEAVYVHLSGAHRKGAIAIESDSRIEGLRRLTDAVHSRGAMIAAQLTHAGRVVAGAIRGADYPLAWAPSAVKHRKTGEISHEMTKDEILLIEKSFAEAAVRAKASGFDAVEVHGTHGYLLMQFMSLISNKRTDEYGGSLENRMRFPLETIREMRKAVGDDYPIIYRIGAVELAEGGYGIEDAVALSVELEKCGVSAIDVSGGINETPDDMSRSIATYYTKEAYFTEYSKKIKAAVNIPVMVVGRLQDPDTALNCIEEGFGDIVVLGRQLIADPFWPQKVMAGETDRIDRCISCNRGCIEEICAQRPMSCVQNSQVGRENDVANAGPCSKKVLVAGAGLAGLEFALRAVQRGADVTVVELGEKAGGQCMLAAVPPGKEGFSKLVSSRVRRLKEAGVEIACNKEITADDAAGYDLVAVTGIARPIKLKADWTDSPICVDAQEILKGNIPVPPTGSKVLVVGGGAVGLETAHMIAEKGAATTVIDIAPSVGNGFVPTLWAVFSRKLAELNVDIKCGTHIAELDGNNAVLEDSEGHSCCMDGINMIVSAVGTRCDASLADELEAKGIDVIRIGTAAGGTNTLEVTRQAFDAALSI